MIMIGLIRLTRKSKELLNKSYLQWDNFYIHIINEYAIFAWLITVHYKKRFPPESPPLVGRPFTIDAE